jgi:hypothetical protein
VLGNTVGYRRGKKSYSRLLPKAYNLSEESIKSGTEFGFGSTACVLTKSAFAPLMLRPFKKNLHNRLSEAFRKVIRSGPPAMKGKRGVFDGNIGLLKNFDFSDKVKFEDIINILPHIELVNKELKMDFPGFNWDSLMRFPKNAERAKLGLGFGFLDFNNNTYDFKLAPELSIDKSNDFPGGNLVLPIPEAEELAVLVMMNIFFEDSTSQNAFKIDNQFYQAGIFLNAIHLRNGEMVIFEQEEIPKAKEKDKWAPDLVGILTKKRTNNHTQYWFNSLGIVVVFI